MTRCLRVIFALAGTMVLSSCGIPVDSRLVEVAAGNGTLNVSPRQCWLAAEFDRDDWGVRSETYNRVYFEVFYPQARRDDNFVLFPATLDNSIIFLGDPSYIGTTIGDWTIRESSYAEYQSAWIEALEIPPEHVARIDLPCVPASGHTG